MTDIEIVVFNDKSYVRLTEYQKVKKENEQLKQEKCELLGIIQSKDELIEKLICCGNCKHHLRDCQNSLICVNNNHKDWELAE